MNPPFSQNPEPLYQAVRRLDRTLSRPSLKRLDLPGIQAALRDLERFHQQAVPNKTLSVRDNAPSAHSLTAAGCRLSVDLNDALITRLVDKLQGHEQAIESLSEQLKAHLQNRSQVQILLKHAQALHQQTQETAESIGLGVVL